MSYKHINELIETHSKPTIFHKKRHEHNQPQNIVYTDKLSFDQKLSNFIESYYQNKKSVAIVTDFDYTLTSRIDYKTGKLYSSSYYLYDEDIIGGDQRSFDERRQALVDKYSHYEFSTSYDIDTRKIKMKEWYSQSLSLYFGEKFTKDSIDEMVRRTKSNLLLRRKAIEYLELLMKLDITVVIESGGIGQFIEGYLKVYLPNYERYKNEKKIIIVSNMFKFDDNNGCVGLEHEVINCFNKADFLGNVVQNKISDIYINGYSKWNYVRCAYSFDSQNYYLNNKPEEDVKSEIYFWNPSQKRNEKGFKMFMKNLVKLIINVSRDNFTRIFIQTINIFREYIPQSIDTKYIKMKEYIFSVSNNYYYPILFSVDFSNDYDIITNRLKYYITDYDWIPETEQYLENFMTNIFSRSYPTYPIYEPFLECGVGKIYNLDLNNLPYCEYITTPDNCNNENTFCINNNQFFWCPEGKYLDINTLSCNDDCPIGYTRPSDVINGYGMCNININHLHYLNYPKNKEDLAVGVYENKFECQIYIV